MSLKNENNKDLKNKKKKGKSWLSKPSRGSDIPKAEYIVEEESFE